MDDNRMQDQIDKAKLEKELEYARQHKWDNPHPNRLERESSHLLLMLRGV